jgi:hypothetical protein
VVADAVEPGPDRRCDLVGLADHGDRLHELVVDQLGHRRPLPRPRPALQLGVELAAVVQLEHRQVRRRRSVEGELLAHRLS